MADKIRVIQVGSDKVLWLNPKICTERYLKRHNLIIEETPEVESFEEEESDDSASDENTSEESTEETKEEEEESSEESEEQHQSEEEPKTKGELLDALLDDGKVNAKELAKWILDCDNIQDIKTVIEGETRVTPLNAAEKRIEQLK